MSKHFIIIFIIYLFFRRKIQFVEAKEIKEKNDFCWFMETSSKSGFNVQNLFFNIGKLLYEETVKNMEVNKVRK